VEQDALSALETGIDRRLFVIPGESKDRLLDLPPLLAGSAEPLLPGLIASWMDSLSPAAENDAFRLQPEDFASHSRAFLKIQDGCDRRCTYCRVSIARGKSRSLAAPEALTALQFLERRGFAEAVIAGVNITQYRDASLDLAGLLNLLLSQTESIRLRLSSIEPDWLTEDRCREFAQVLAQERIQPHFHLSVQSGSAAILSKMGRPYAPADIERALALFRSVRHDPFLACDIIAGFPGESDADFEKTYALCESSQFAWIHAFPFSPRPGTAAWDFPKTVSDREAAARVQRLTDLARKGRRQYIARWQGKEVQAIAETGAQEQGKIPAVSENYLKLLVDCGTKPPPPAGSLLRCRILAAPDGNPSADARFDASASLC